MMLYETKSKADECSTDQSKSIWDATFDAESHCDHRIANTTAFKRIYSHQIKEQISSSSFHYQSII